MPNVQIIAVLDHKNKDEPFALKSLQDVIHLHDGLSMISADDRTVQFTGPKKLLNAVAAQFAGRLLFEENKALTLDVPGPVALAKSVSNQNDDINDDKDPDEVVHF